MTRFIFMVCAALLALSACGIKGELKRPSEIKAEESEAR